MGTVDDVIYYVDISCTIWAWTPSPAPDPASPEQGDLGVKPKGVCEKHPWPCTFPPSTLEMRGLPPVSDEGRGFEGAVTHQGTWRSHRGTQLTSQESDGKPPLAPPTPSCATRSQIETAQEGECGEVRPLPSSLSRPAVAGILPPSHSSSACKCKQEDVCDVCVLTPPLLFSYKRQRTRSVDIRCCCCSCWVTKRPVLGPPAAVHAGGSSSFTAAWCSSAQGLAPDEPP